MSKKLPKISDAEWEVMKVVWESHPLTSTEIIESIKPCTQWSSKTIHTLINRLVKKKALGVNKEASLYSFYPIVSEKECQREETKSFLQKFYDGSLSLLVANFIKDHKISPDEIEELRQILEKKKK